MTDAEPGLKKFLKLWKYSHKGNSEGHILWLQVRIFGSYKQCFVLLLCPECYSIIVRDGLSMAVYNDHESKVPVR